MENLTRPLVPHWLQRLFLAALLLMVGGVQLR